jgi:hypothetical protein
LVDQLQQALTNNFLFADFNDPKIDKLTPFQKLPGYQAPEDPNYKCNFDRLLETLTVRVTKESLAQMKFKDFFDAFANVSVFGARTELLNEQTLQPEIYTFLPTLSSLSLEYSRKKVGKKLDFDSEAD